MKALTLKHPWAFAVRCLGKDVENRTWHAPRSSLPVGSWYAVHGGVVPNGYELQDAIDGVHDLTDEFGPELRAFAAARGLADFAVRDALTPGVVAVVKHGGCVTASASRWFEGPVGWVIADRFALPEPVPCKGAQGLWDLPPEVLAEVRRQWRESKKEVPS